MIVIPAIDVRGGRVVRLTRGVAGSETAYGEDPVDAARRFVSEGAAWLHLVDLDAALGTGGNLEVIREVVAATGAPVQVGGGLRSLEAVEETLILGAARVILGTAAIEDPALVREVTGRFPDRVVVALDTDGTDVLTEGWTEDAGPVEEILPRLEAAGATRFLATAVDRDGTMDGPDLDLYRRLGTLTRHPIQASGGVGGEDHIRALRGVKVEAVIVGKALYEGSLSLPAALEAAS
ncbi:MAG TPA: 1-(5-phosphoribosyl)-5-[(5-phosphoribosylamino)methylideneamino]imidazole-4-carboxamide isomerase [Actinomycetota bacterium]